MATSEFRFRDLGDEVGGRQRSSTLRVLGPPAREIGYDKLPSSGLYIHHQQLPMYGVRGQWVWIRVSVKRVAKDLHAGHITMYTFVCM